MKYKRNYLDERANQAISFYLEMNKFVVCMCVTVVAKTNACTDFNHFRKQCKISIWIAQIILKCRLF